MGHYLRSLGYAASRFCLLRKGGIHEDGKDFRVIHREFLLYPTYEHQKADAAADGASAGT